MTLPVNQIICGDCLDVMRDWPDASVDLVVTSPPYNMRLRIRNGQYTTRERSEHFSRKYAWFDDAMPPDEFYAFHSAVMTELLRVARCVVYNIQLVTGSKAAFFRILGDNAEQIKDVIV